MNHDELYQWCWAAGKANAAILTEFAAIIDWQGVSYAKTFDVETALLFEDNIHWDTLSRWMPLTVEFVKKFEDKINWFEYSKYNNPSKKIVTNYGHKLDKARILTHHPQFAFLLDREQK